tara:strand:- start:1036 stop:1737 length:702 start_codon:yes stop_codon:yes gene_type:complete
MELNLPELDIQPDLDILAEDDKEDLGGKPIQQEVKVEMDIEEKEDPIFKKPKKQKKPPSEKQLAHLSRIRQIAKEKKALKTKAKAEALAKVNEEHKAKSYKPRKKKVELDENKRIIEEVIEEQTQAYKEKTIAKEYIEPSKITPNESNTPEDFNKSHKEKVKKDKVNKEEEERNSFMKFMSNMETYKKMKSEYKAKQPKPPPRPRTTQQVARQEPPSILKPPDPPNPYADYFG